MENLEILHRILTLAPAYKNVSAEQERVFGEILRLCEPDIACFYDSDRNEKKLVVRAVYPEDRWRTNRSMDEFRTRKLDVGAIGRAIREKAAVLVSRPDEEAARGEYIPFCREVQSEIVVPIFARQTLHGVLVLSRFGGRPFGLRDLRHVEIAAEGLALAYHALGEKEARERTVQFLREISELHPSDVDGAMTAGLRSIREFLECEFATLWLYNEVDSTLVIRAFEPTDVRGNPITFDSFYEKVVVFDGTSYEGHSVGRVQDESVFEDEMGGRFGLQLKSSFPIVRRSKGLWGILNVYEISPTQSFFEVERTRTVALLASKLVDVSSLWLLSQRNSIVARCDQVLHEMDRGESQKLWDELARLIADQMQCEACSIFMEQHSELSLKGTTGIIGNPPYRSVKYKPGKGLTGGVFLSGAPVIYYEENAEAFRVKHISAFREKLKSSELSRSILMVPVRDALNKTVGIIRCINKDTSLNQHCGRFTREDVEHLSLIGEVAYHTVFRAAWLLERETQQQSYLDRLHHEVLSPLDGILNHVDWLSRIFSARLPVDPDQADLIRRRSSDVVAAARLIEMIVKSIGYEEKDEHIGKPKPLHLTAMLHTCRGWLLSTARPKGVEINIVYVGDRAKVWGDEFKMIRVFYNLMMNAIKYSDKRESTRYVRIIGGERGGWFEITFEDNGIGVPDDDVNAIFDKYFRCENAQRVYPEGSGLGLSYCRHIVESHNGTLDLAHNRKPTLFRVLLPMRSRGGN